MTARVFEAGIIQCDIHLGDVEENLAKVGRRITTLAQKGVRLVLLPEIWSTGFAHEQLEALSKTTPDVLENLAWLSKELHVTIIGSMPEKVADGIYNTAYVVDVDGCIAGVYRKVHLFSLTGEDQYFRPGNKAVVAETSVGRVGLMICYDLRFPDPVACCTRCPLESSSEGQGHRKSAFCPWRKPMWPGCRPDLWRTFADHIPLGRGSGESRERSGQPFGYHRF
jgi:predicted amidohydrolase